MKVVALIAVLVFALTISLTLAFNTEWFGRGWTILLIIITNVAAFDLLDRIAPTLDEKEKGDSSQ